MFSFELGLLPRRPPTRRCVVGVTLTFTGASLGSRRLDEQSARERMLVVLLEPSSSRASAGGFRNGLFPSTEMGRHMELALRQRPFTGASAKKSAS